MKKDSGRPLSNIEAPKVDSAITTAHSSDSNGSGVSKRSNFSKSTVSTANSASLLASKRSYTSYQSSASATSTTRGSVFNRLASTGTKPSLRKHMKSSTYDNT